jgi:hypothetical protein
MSALGHKRTHAVRQLGSLLDHLVGDREKGGRHGEAEHLRGLMIDKELELSFSFAKLASESPDRVATATPCRPNWKPAPEADFWAEER